MKKCIILIRVSTFIQDYTAQTNELISWSKELGFEDYTLIQDKESGIKLKEEERNGLNKLKELIEKDRDYSAVLIYEISRLARTQKVLFSMREYFLENKINLYIFDKKYHLLNEDGTENSDAGILFSLYSYFSESEMKVKKQRFARARKQLNIEGRYTGGWLPKGYKVNDEGYIVINEKEAEEVRLIFQLYSTGKYSIRGLMTEMRELGYKTTFDAIAKGLKNEDYIGKEHNFRRLPAIISEELFNKCLKIRTKNRTYLSNRNSKEALCSKLIVCPKCGNHFSLVNRAYQCVYLSLHKCDNKDTISQIILDKLIWYIIYNEAINERSKDLSAKYSQLITTYYKKAEVLEKQLEKYKDKLERNTSVYINGDISKEKYEKNKETIKFLKDNDLKQREWYLLESQRLSRIIRRNDDNTDFKKLPFAKKYELVHSRIKELKLFKDPSSRRMTYIDCITYLTDYHYLIDTRTGKAKYIDLKYDKDITKDVESL